MLVFSVLNLSDNFGAISFTLKHIHTKSISLLSFFAATSKDSVNLSLVNLSSSSARSKITLSDLLSTASTSWYASKCFAAGTNLSLWSEQLPDWRKGRKELFMKLLRNELRFSWVKLFCIKNLLLSWWNPQTKTSALCCSERCQVIQLKKVFGIQLN